MLNDPICLPFTDEHRMVAEMMHDFAVREVAPHSAEWDEREIFPEEHFREKLGMLGVLGPMVPREYGGAGGDAVTATIVLEELGYADASYALSYIAHAVLCVNNLTVGGNEEQKRRYLPKLCNGEWLGAMGMTEPGAGSDAVGMRTTAVRKGDRYILNGSKTFITNGGVADVFCVYAKTDPAAGANGLSVFIVEKRFPGFSVGRDIHKMGHRASSTTELIFEDCEVPAANLMGRENGGYTHFKRGLDIERITISGIPVGMMRRCLDVATTYAGQRTQFGKPIGTFQEIKHMLAESYADLRAARLLTYNAAFNAIGGSDCTVEAAVCKLFSAQAVSRVAANAVQILGGYGYTREYPVERMMRDAKLYEIGAGTNEIQRMLISKGLMDSI